RHPWFALFGVVLVLVSCSEGKLSTSSEQAFDPRLDFRLQRMIERDQVDEDLADPTMPGQVPVLIRGNVARADLEAHGAAVGTQAGPITTGWVPLGRLRSLLTLGEIEAIDAPRELHPLLDMSTKEVGAPTLWYRGNAPAAAPYPPPYTGPTGK